MAEAWVVGVAVLLGLAALVVVIVVPLSFSDVHYYEYGILKRRSTGTVNLDKIYTAGRYLVGPDHTFKTFRADAHFVDLDNVAVFTHDKVEVIITCRFQYFIRRQYLGKLHDAYDVDYKPIVTSTAIDAIKGRAAFLPIDDYIRNREGVETELFKALMKRLDGCCRSSCENTLCQKFEICKTEGSCKAKDYGLFVEVKYFQLHKFDMHNDVKSRYLKQVIEAAEEEKATFVLQEKVVLKETEKQVNQIKNEATLISQNASSQATIIHAQARAEALKMVENARTNGLRNLYIILGIANSNSTHALKASLIYLRMLRKKKNVSLNVNYKSILLKG